MATTATPERVMGDLHLKVSNRLIREVDNEECDPRYLGMAIKFLSDNKVSMIPEISNELGELDKSLKKRKQRFGKDNITDIATKLAHAEGE